MPIDERWYPVIAVLVLVAMVAAGTVLGRLVKPKRRPGDPLPEEPVFGRKTLPTLDEEEEAQTPMSEEPPSNLPVCRVCGELLQPDIVTMEMWDQVSAWLGQGSWTRALLEWLRVIRPVDPGRQLYVEHGYCMSCAAIAQPLDRTHRDAQAVKRLAEDRQWERVGLPRAVRQAIEQERERDADEQKRLERARRPWRND